MPVPAQQAFSQKPPAAPLANAEPLALSPARSRAFDLHLQHCLRGDAAADAGLSAMAAEHFATGGKRLRARLALAAASALGASDAQALPWAVACEVLHNATLVHDDLQDGDTTRRGHPCVWVKHGAAQAINVGDWLFMRAFAAVDEADALSHATQGTLCRLLRCGLQTVIVGQARECGWRGGDIVTPALYAQMVCEKTAALFALPVHGAAVLAGASPEQATHMAQAFAAVGELFQWVDDVIDLFGDKGRAQPGQDLYEGKMSALAVLHAQHVPSDAPWLTALLRTPRQETPERDVARARRAFLQSGTLSRVMQRIDVLATDGCADAALAPVHKSLVQAIAKPLTQLHADAKEALHVA